MIRAVALNKHFGLDVAVERLDLEIAEGEVFGLLGPQGAGKTTALRMLATLIAPTAGQAWIGDLELGINEATNRRIRRVVGVMPQVSGLEERLSAEQNLRLYAGLYGLPNASTQAQRYLQLVDLWEQRRAPVASFSRVMKQKLALARALLHEPRVLLLDEPTVGLKEEAALALWQMILELRSEGLTILLCTRNLVEVSNLCDRVGIFRHALVRVDTPERLCQEVWERQILFRMRGRAGPYEHLLSELPFVRTVILSDNTLVAALSIGAEKREAVAAMVRRLVEAGADLFDVGEAEQSREDAYLALLEDTDSGALLPAVPARSARTTQPPPPNIKKGGQRR